MGTPPEIFGFALTYLRLIFVAMPPSTVTIIVGMGLRGAGDAQTSLRFMIVAVGLDVLLNPLLIGRVRPGAGARHRRVRAGQRIGLRCIHGRPAHLCLLARSTRCGCAARTRQSLIPDPGELRYILVQGPADGRADADDSPPPASS